MIARVSKALNKKDGDKGFTLIELLVVVIIIGILAAIAIPVFLNQRRSAVDAGVKSDIRTVANELETWFTNNQTYVTAVTGATAGTQTTLTFGANDGTTIGGNTVFRSNPATQFRVTLNAADFVIEARNADNGTGGIFQYDSDGGGLQSTPTGGTW